MLERQYMPFLSSIENRVCCSCQRSLIYSSRVHHLRIALAVILSSVSLWPRFLINMSACPYKVPLVVRMHAPRDFTRCLPCASTCGPRRFRFTLHQFRRIQSFLCVTTAGCRIFRSAFNSSSSSSSSSTLSSEFSFAQPCVRRTPAPTFPPATGRVSLFAPVTPRSVPCYATLASQHVPASTSNTADTKPSRFG
jgi:hypothetical protein